MRYGGKYPCKLDAEAKVSVGFRILKRLLLLKARLGGLQCLKDCRSHWLKCLPCLDFIMRLLSNRCYCRRYKVDSYKFSWYVSDDCIIPHALPGLII